MKSVKKSLRIINKKRSLYFIQNVARNVKLKFGAIWMKNVKRSLRIINEKVTLFYSKRR